MPDPDQTRSYLYRDGVSQAGRALPALSPDAARVDEREPADWLAFLGRYAAKLRYYNLDDEVQGDWTAFLASVADPARLAEVADYLANPAAFTDARYDAWRRPHFALLLTFLDLLRPVRDQANTFTRRHLDFYYRDLLGFRPRPAGSGRVHVLVEPQIGQGPFLLSAGTLLNAGRDTAGKEVHYRTDDDLVVTPAQVRECRSLFLRRTFVGLDDVRRNPDALLGFLLPRVPVWQHEPTAAEKSFQALMEVALGEPGPGGALPNYPPLPGYPYPPDLATAAGTIPVDKTLFIALDRLLAYLRDPGGLALSLPAFRRLMALRHSLQVRLDPDTAAGWAQVNAALQTAGRKKRNDPAYTLTPARADDFVTNLKTALGFSDAAYATLYNTLPSVQDVYGLSRHIQDDAVAHFVTDTLAFASVADFMAMMTIVNGFYQRWQAILEVLRGAGRRRQKNDPTHVVDPPNLRDPNPNDDLWQRLVQHTIGNLGTTPLRVADNPMASLDAMDAEVQRLEQSFQMSADDFTALRTATRGGSATAPWKWDETYAILTAARTARDAAMRRAAIQHARQPAADNRTNLLAMVVAALGVIDPKNPAAGPGLPAYAKGFFDLDLGSAPDADYVQTELFLTPEEMRTLRNLGASAGPVGWETVATILDEARGRRDQRQPPTLEFESWDNVFAAPDATAVRSGTADAATARWRTFGDGLRADGATAPAAFGFMVASPLLALAAGVRTVTLTLEFTKASATLQNTAVQAALARTSAPFRFLLSTAKGPLEIAPANAATTWTPGTAVAGAAGPAPNLRFVMTLREDAPPVAGSPVPFLQVLPRDLTDPDHPDAPPKKIYDAFRSLVLAHVRLEVTVAGLTDVLLQNDHAALDPKKPFEPFTTLPMVGSRFLLAHPEICTKSLSRLEIGLDWLGLPPLASWYASYPVSITGSGSFNAFLKLHDARAFWNLKSVPVFGDGVPSTLNPPAPADTSPPAYVRVTADEVKAKYANYGPAPAGRVGDDPLDYDRYWLLELQSPDFLHSIYPQAAARAARAAPPVILNPPYTPLARRLVVNYAASLELDPANNPATAPDQLFLLEPFGVRPLRIDPATPPEDVPPALGAWLPQYDLEGQLFIGLASLDPPQNLTLLFQMAAGSADPDVTPPPVLWSYLDGNEWRELDDGHLLADTTRGLRNAGIAVLDLPAARPGTLLPADLYWLRLAVARDSRGIADVVEVRAQAVAASLAPDSPGASALALVPGTITALAKPQPQVKAIRQPYSPFDVVPPEGDAHFATRVSERLRHKGRALTCWDYERLVLEAFPEIYKAKCLAVDSADDPRAPAVRVVVVPDIRGKLPSDPFEPKVPADTLRHIADFLADRCAAGAALRVQNPRYCSLRLRFSVRLRPGCNPGFYLPRLNDEVCRFLSPWAFDDSADIVFGSRVSTNLVVYFLEQRSYVDYVTDLQLFLGMDGQPLQNVPGKTVDLTAVAEGAPDVILVSVPRHDIDLVTGDRYVRTSFVGVDYMKVELDFSVA